MFDLSHLHIFITKEILIQRELLPYIIGKKHWHINYIQTKYEVSIQYAGRRDDGDVYKVIVVNHSIVANIGNFTQKTYENL
jgi:Uri superfamily endonuclease